jgi:hypothetical protein
LISFLFFSSYILHRLARYILELNSYTLDKTACKGWLRSRCLHRTTQTKRKTCTYIHDQCGLETDNLCAGVAVDRDILGRLATLTLNIRNAGTTTSSTLRGVQSILRSRLVYSGQPIAGSGPRKGGPGENIYSKSEKVNLSCSVAGA